MDLDPSVAAKVSWIRDKQAIGKMLFTDERYEDVGLPRRVLVDVSKLDGKQLLSAYAERQSKFATAPFDPEGHRLRLYPGGVTVWSGFPGAGKTTLLRQLICHLLAANSKVFLASLEEDPENVLVSLAATAAGRELPSAHQVQWFIDAHAERFRLWGQIGIAEHRQLLAIIKTLAEDQGIEHAVIDSLMCLDVANDDFEKQRQFSNLLAAVARVYRVHIHLVAHPRKPAKTEQELDTSDVAGAKEIGAIADNVIFVRRAIGTEAIDPLTQVTPMSVSVKKQRHGSGAIGNISGWFHRHYRQFHLEQFQQLPTRYLPEDAYL